MIDTLDIDLAHGIRLSCRVAGPMDAPVLLFLHGFPEAAFVWDELLLHFEGRYRCVAPNLRGYERSSAPADMKAYRARHLVGDIDALIERLGGRVRAFVAHDWGGAIAWNVAAQVPARMEQLVIINAPHPALFLDALQHDARQQAASAYMTFLCRDDSARLLAENDYTRLWSFLEGHGRRPEWLSDELKVRYRSVWGRGLEGPLNFYRASPLRPPTQADRSVMDVQLPPEMVKVRVPTRVVWAEADGALLPLLVQGLDRFVEDLTLVRIPGATHWVIHEQPARIAEEIEAALSGAAGRAAQTTT